MLIFHPLALVPLLASIPTPAVAQTTTANELPVREVTVFKDGHAFLVRADTRPTDARGEVVLDGLPEPLLGTFWPFASGTTRLLAARAARASVDEEREARDLEELLRANLGVQMTLTDMDGGTHSGRLLGLTRPDVTVPQPTPGYYVPPAPMPANLGALVRLEVGPEMRVLPLRRVREFAVQGDLRTRFRVSSERERLTLHTDRPAADVEVGVAYVQHGLRWIPAYRIELGEGGKAAVKLEATLVNDLVDLAGATVHLVVGAPKFEFAGELDPIALLPAAAQASASSAGRANLPNNPNAFLSNSLRTQSASSGEVTDLPAARDGGANEDLYLYTVRDVSLARGERLVLPLAEFQLPYRDVYVLSVPLTPPEGRRQQFDSEQELALARELAQPKAVHTLRFENTHTAPLTTAPALVLKNGLPLAQGRLRYTPAGGRCDLAINAAVEVGVVIGERETAREEVRLLNTNFQEVTLQGSVTLTNGKREAIELEVARDVAGRLGEIGQEGAHVERSWNDFLLEAPSWWYGYGWEGWWYRLNGLARVSWKRRLEPGASVRLEVDWRYYWR
jgi:hypothetical protein